MGRQMALAGAAGTAAIGFLAKGAADFDKGMREVNTLLGASESELQSLSQQTRELSMELGVNAVDATGALYQAISAGVPAENVIDFMRTAGQAAIGGVTDLETAVDGLTSVTNAYGAENLSTQQAADLMFTAVKEGKTTFDELASSLFNVVPIASATGINFNEITAGMAALTLQGVPTTVATTQLRAAIQALSAPTIRQKQTMEDLGLEFNATKLAQNGLLESFREVIAASGGDMAVLRKLIGSVEGLQAVLALGGDQSETFAGILDEMGMATGAAGAAFTEMEKSSSQDFAKMKAQIMDLRIELGDALMPAIMGVMDSIQQVLTPVIQWIKENPELTAQIATWTVGIVAATVALGVLFTVLGTIITVVGGLTAAIGTLIAVALSPVGLAIAAIVLAGVMLIKNWESVREVGAAIFQFLGEMIENWVNIHVEGINAVLAGLEKFANFIPGVSVDIGRLDRVNLNLGENFKAVGDWIVEATDKIQEKAGDLKRTFTTLGETGQVASETIVEGVEAVEVAIEQVGTTVAEVEQEVDLKLRAFKDHWDRVNDPLMDGPFNDPEFGVQFAENLQLAADEAERLALETEHMDESLTGLMKLTGLYGRLVKNESAEREKQMFLESLTAEEAKDNLLDLIEARARIVQSGGSVNALGQTLMSRAGSVLGFAQEQATGRAGGGDILQAMINRGMGGERVEQLLEILVGQGRGAGTQAGIALSNILPSGVNFGSGALTDAERTAMAAQILGAFPSFATGGVMPHDGFAMLHAGETITPSGEGGGGDMHFHFPNYVGDRAEMEKMIRDGLHRLQDRGVVTRSTTR